MNDADFDFPKLVKDRIAALQTTPFAVEQAHDLPPDAIRNVIRNSMKLKQSSKSDGPTLSRALEIARALGLEFRIGPPREPATLQPLQIAEGEFVPIPERAAQLAAGDGHVNDGDLIIGHLVFRKDWLQRLGILAEKASLARVTGNSMAPLIRDSDLVLVDTQDRAKEVPVRPMKPGKAASIYVFHQDGGDRVKRIARPTDEMTLILSDNPEFPPEVLTGPRQRALNIIGRVRWWGHTVEE